MKIKDKDRGDHDVPLPPALVAMLKEWRRMDTKTSTFVCPAPRDPLRHITPEAIEKHYREVLSLAGKHSPHSWRSTLSTIARNAGKHVDSIERQLDHGEWDKSAEPYNRARLLELRRELMNWYADTITAARDRIRNRPA
jgi:integrase